jgi:hypothetical protein
MATFGIDGPTALFHKLLEEQGDFEKSGCISSRHAINAIMTAYHLHEWVWGDFVKKRSDLHAAWQLAPDRRVKCADFRAWLSKDEQCPTMIDAQAVTNGTKHFGEHVPTGAHEGCFDPLVFDKNAFDVPYLWIESNGGKKTGRRRHSGAGRVLAEVFRQSQRYSVTEARGAGQCGHSAASW